MRNNNPLIALVLCAVLAAGATAEPAWAEESGMPPVDPGRIPEGEEVPVTVSVMGVDLVPKKGLFEVTADTKVRGGPGTEFGRVDSLVKGDRVHAIGRTDDGQWFAISRDGKTLGFIYANILMPVLDGTLPEPFFGQFSSEVVPGGVVCDYRFRFERKNEVEGGDFETADYEVRFRCASQDGAALFYVHMYLTEAPVDNDQGMHLIGIDARSVGDGMSDYLSTSFLYDPKGGRMVFDGHTLPQYALPPKVKEFKAKGLKTALQTALETTLGTWTAEAWAVLLKKPE